MVYIYQTDKGGQVNHEGVFLDLKLNPQTSFAWEKNTLLFLNQFDFYFPDTNSQP
jgi:hypothetical protein